MADAYASQNVGAGHRLLRSTVSDIRNFMKAPEKNRGGRPKVGSVLIAVRVPPNELAELDAWRGLQGDPKPSRPVALRRLAKLAMDEAKRKR
jgi:hypothetical protein